MRILQTRVQNIILVCKIHVSHVIRLNFFTRRSYPIYLIFYVDPKKHKTLLLMKLQLGPD